MNPEQLKTLFGRLAQMVKANTTGINTGTGITNYNLEPVAKTLFPVITPLRNSIPRKVDNNGGTGINWKAITAINPGGTPSTMREGRRSGYIDQTEADYSVNFATIGLENYVTEQAIMAAKGFDDALSIAADNLLWSTMISEEMLDLGGNQSYTFGTQAAPTGTAVAGGALASGTALIAKCVALTLDGYTRTLQNGMVVQTITRTNGDGTSDVINGGTSILSAASAGATPSGSNLAITWKTTAKPGAFGYAWFTGTTSGQLQYAGLTSINVFTQTTAPAAGAQLDGALANVDYSANPLAYNGLVPIAANAGAYTSLDGATLTADGAGGVVEIDAFLAAFYISRKVSPTKMWVNPQESNNITRKVLSGGSGSGAVRNTDQGSGNIRAGAQVTSYLNKYAVGGSTVIPIETHPNLPAGKIFFDCENIPYPLANIPGARRKILRRDFWQTLWPQITMNRQTGVYFDGALQVYTPFALGVLDNIGNG